MNSYSFIAKHENVEKMISPIVSSLEEIDAPFKSIYQIQLALEEIIVNIVNYAFKDEPGTIDISYEINKDNKEITIIIKDKGIGFNPLTKEDPEFEGSAKERKIGGLGIYIVKNIIDDIKYERTNDYNVLTLVKII